MSAMSVRVGKRIEMARKQKGWTQFDLAANLDMSRGAVCHYETGAREPSLTMLDQLADTLGVTMDYLFGRERAK